MRAFVIALIAFLVAAVFAGLGYFAPRFLVYSNGYERADAIVVLLGPDFRARHQHAKNLLHEGMADYLIIPAYGRTYRMELDEMTLVGQLPRKNIGRRAGKSMIPQYFEDTHLEILNAREMMNRYGRKSAIFVSSPYHMRRIKMIVSKVFGQSSGFYFSPTPFENRPVEPWRLKLSDWKKIFQEYVKIAWFNIYSVWVK
ncbi:MAG TPA: YdcF family protein [Smithellaceae bacterium]|nr:YdcF family protein [Syntrophaceae bacterium]HPV48404.1 YdcF family protein [Smithellaceae bacterium]